MESVTLCNIYSLFCPVTGKQILFSESEPKPSEATLFIYVSEGGFEFLHPNLMGIWNEVQQKATNKFEWFDLFLQELKEDENIIDFEFADHLGLSVHVGIDFNYQLEE